VRADHIYSVSTRLPDALAPLRDIAMDLGTGGDERARDLFRRVDPDSHHLDDYLKLLSRVPQDRLDALAGDASFVAAATALREDLARLRDAPRWYQLEHGTEAGRDDLGLVAYFSLEFGVAEGLPVYSGGLGILAGDHLKAAADLGVPIVGIGLFYHYGYLQQSLDRSGWQRELSRQLNPHALALSPVDVDVVVDLAGVATHLRVWRAEIGRVQLYLLDTDVERNAPAERAVGDRLYGGDAEHRIRQEIVLGVGGVRLLDHLGFEASVFHMNEGHAAFSALERIRKLVVITGMSFDEAIEATRPSQLFTTHTPVPAGIDRFPRELIEKYFTSWADECKVDIDRLMELGHEPGTAPAADEGAVLNLAAMGLRLAGGANGVSQLHGEVSREMFAPLWPGLPADEVPIGAITNGVHGRTWVSREMADLLDRVVGTDWPEAGPDAWARMDEVTDEELWAIRRVNRERLVTYARRHARESLLARGMSEAEAAWADDVLDPSVFTIVFARRFAPYKRATMLLHDLERLRALLSSKKRPVQVVFAGKAHPADEPGKHLLRQVVELATNVEWRDRLVFLDDYDIGVARMLVRGADLWLNTPVRRLEACGTSGMKASLNGVLNCSILDGWWDELFDGDVGWAIPSAEWVENADERNAIESHGLLTLLEHQIIPTFYDRDADGIPVEWTRRMRACVSTLGPSISASRMVREYVDDWYLPAARRSRRLAQDDFAAARALVNWRARIASSWRDVHILGITHEEQAYVGDPQRVWADVALGNLTADEVEVQLWHGRVEADDHLHDPQRTVMQLESASGPTHGARFVASLSSLEQGSFGFTVRVVPSHPQLRDDVLAPFVAQGTPQVSCLD
jgi:starch phosphorylase